MTLIATPAGATSDSYLTVADADAFAGADLGPESVAWLDADDVDTKERALKRATREIDMYLEPAWDRYSDTQALQFPRSVDATGATPYIPASVRVATYQQAIYLLKNHRVLAAANVRRYRADGTDEGDGFGADPDAGPSVISPIARLALARFRKVAGATRGGLRSSRILGGLAVSR